MTIRMYLNPKILNIILCIREFHLDLLISVLMSFIFHFYYYLKFEYYSYTDYINLKQSVNKMGKNIDNFDINH